MDKGRNDRTDPPRQDGTGCDDPMNGLGAEKTSAPIRKNTRPERAPISKPEYADVHIINTADPGELMPGRRKNSSTSQKESKAEYGIISLFDGLFSHEKGKLLSYRRS